MAGIIKRYDDHIEVTDKETNRLYRIFEEDGSPVVETYYFSTKKRLDEEDGEHTTAAPASTAETESAAAASSEPAASAEPATSGRRILGIPVGS